MSDPVQDGKFVWRDLMTTDPEKAEAFYTGLFGWSINPVDMGEFGAYRMFRHGNQDFGGVVPLDAGAGVPSHWLSYIAVSDVDATAAKAAELGGTVSVPPTDIPSVGRFCVVIDPQGATFSPMTDAADAATPSAPDDAGAPATGGVSWNELMTDDPDAAKSFYTQLIGYSAEATDMGGGPYTVLKAGAQQAGLVRKPAEMPGSAWLIYFDAPDLDQSLAEVTRLGGQPIGEILSVPTVGRISWAMDPTGALFALHEGPK